MLFWLTVITAFLCVTYSDGTCTYGCTCYSDSTCTYYCNNNMCQYSIPWGNKCSGHYLHPNECGTGAYCDSSTYTCRYLKSTGGYCSLDWECYSNYCDYSSMTCEYRSTTHWSLVITLPVVFTCLTLFLIIVIVVVRTRRRQLFAHQAFAVQPPYGYQNPTVVCNSPPPYPYQPDMSKH
ncbi:unnamed protein product [Didymodactylos carnosus]|uniref:Uncharacterized protein n=1 Tax=Didymodactylos carnosus TaxID=1234261 RepID=A0A814XW56_9BILA|nr:unnamed protein product [Didymodactylos carnosus]CAF1221547.1 unnamed protein product [Didymodactylos carnosus]CAF3679544.1 unnamed protein product [Didymodactylos carnosus]CAF3984824.1 unnamed protein product [Didymodactylos carnosus]